MGKPKTDSGASGPGAANRGKRPSLPDGAATGSGAGAGGGGSPEDYDSDPQGGGGSLTQPIATPRPDKGRDAPSHGSR